MTRIARDPLLSIARAVLSILQVFVGMGIAGCVIGLAALPFALIFKADILAHVTSDLAPLPYGALVAGAAGLLGFGLAMLACLLVVFRTLRRIVDTVGEGDPFVPENATRLTRMAWLTLAIQLLSIPLTAIGAWVDHLQHSAHIDGNVTVDAGLSGNGLLLVLILFILARVFRQGAAMRADLEGMV